MSFATAFVFFQNLSRAQEIDRNVERPDSCSWGHPMVSRALMWLLEDSKLADDSGNDDR